MQCPCCFKGGYEGAPRRCAGEGKISKITLGGNLLDGIYWIRGEVSCARASGQTFVAQAVQAPSRSQNTETPAFKTFKRKVDLVLQCQFLSKIRVLRSPPAISCNRCCLDFEGITEPAGRRGNPESAPRNQGGTRGCQVTSGPCWGPKLVTVHLSEPCYSEHLTRHEGAGARENPDRRANTKNRYFPTSLYYPIPWESKTTKRMVFLGCLKGTVL